MFMFLAVTIAMFSFAPIAASVTTFAFGARWLLHRTTLAMSYRRSARARPRIIGTSRQ